MTALARALLHQKSAPAQAAGRASGHVTVEVADAGALAGLDDAWRDLLSRAADRNPFMDPALLQASAEAYPQLSQYVLLAWDKGENRRLLGVWVFACGARRGRCCRSRFRGRRPFRMVSSARR